MIICHCRNISDQDFDTTEELFERLRERDRDCCSCIAYMARQHREFKLPTDCCLTKEFR